MTTDPLVTSDPIAGERRAWGWVAALRSGETTGWSQWRGEGEQHGPYLPGAQQLELLRRLNLASGASRPSRQLVDRVVTASAPGRGTPDLELVGAARETPFGPRPIDPADLADAELLRVATSLLAEDLVAAGERDQDAQTAGRRWPLVRRRSYRVVGDAWLATHYRDELTRLGRPPGGKRPTVFVVATDLPSVLVHAYTARAFDEGGPPWEAWLAGVAARRHLPPRGDLNRTLRTWTERVGPGRVEVVLDATLLPRLLGVRRPVAAPPALSADAVDLARWVGAPLSVLVLPAARRRLLHRELLPRVAGLSSPAGPALGVPETEREWLHQRAVKLRDRLLSAGYAVHGRPDALLPPPLSGTGTAGAPDDAGVLALALRLLLEEVR